MIAKKQRKRVISPLKKPFGPEEVHYIQRLHSFIEGAIGRDELKKIDGAFEKYVRALKPQWDEVYRSLETSGPTWTQIAFPDTNAIAWRTQAVKKEPEITVSLNGRSMRGPWGLGVQNGSVGQWRKIKLK